MNGKLRIAFIVTKLSKAAPILYTRTLIDYLLPHAYIEVYYFDDVVEMQFPCAVKRIGFKEDFSFNNFDVFHSHGLRPDLYLARNKKKIKGVTVSTIHSYIHYDINSQYNALVSFIFCKLWLRALNKIEYVVALSKDMETYYRNYLNKSKLTFVHSGHKLPQITQPLTPKEIQTIKKFKGNTTLVGVIANLRKQKGVAQIIEAISLDPGYSLIVIGDGNNRVELEKQAIKNKCIDRCLFTGHKSDAHKYLSLIDIYAMTSYQEGFGLVNLEAALNNKPVVCSDINIFREIFSESTVSFFQLNNINSLLAALYKVKENYDYYAKNLNDLVLAKYTPDEMGKAYLNLYKKAINEFSH